MDPMGGIVYAGAACVMYGIREMTGDIDVIIRCKSTFDKMSYGNSSKRYTEDGVNKHSVEFEGGISVHYCNEAINDASLVIIDGVCCHTQIEILRWKLKINREKDKSDISKLILLLGIDLDLDI
jgi:hypothetical protein